MESLPRSTSTFRRSGSSGLVWDERFLSGELKQIKKEENQESSSAGNSGRRMKELRVNRSLPRVHKRDVPAGEDPPSPRMGCCFCAGVKHGDSRNRRARHH